MDSEKYGKNCFVSKVKLSSKCGVNTAKIIAFAMTYSIIQPVQRSVLFVMLEIVFPSLCDYL